MVKVRKMSKKVEIKIVGNTEIGRFLKRKMIK
jgi:hypothetical protein